MLGIKFPDLRGVQRAEIWGIVAIACFNLAFLSVALRFGNLGQNEVLCLVGAGEILVAGVLSLLFGVRHSRDRMDDFHKSLSDLRLLLDSQANTIQSISDSKTNLKDVLERLIVVLEKELPCQKNLPPS